MSTPQVTIAPLPGNLLVNVQYPLTVAGFTPAVQDVALVKAYPAVGATLTWTPIGTQGKATVLFLATQPGSYTIVIAYVASDGSVATAEQVVTVGGGVAPANPPQPGPAPQPSPPDNHAKIKPGKLWLIVTVPSLTQLTGDLAAVQESVALGSSWMVPTTISGWTIRRLPRRILPRTSIWPVVSRRASSWTRIPTPSLSSSP